MRVGQRVDRRPPIAGLARPSARFPHQQSPGGKRVKGPMCSHDRQFRVIGLIYELGADPRIHRVASDWIEFMWLDDPR